MYATLPASNYLCGCPVDAWCVGICVPGKALMRCSIYTAFVIVDNMIPSDRQFYHHMLACHTHTEISCGCATLLAIFADVCDIYTCDPHL